MKAQDLKRTVIALVIAVAFVDSGAVRLPQTSTAIMHAPVFAYSDLQIQPFVVMAKKTLAVQRDMFGRAVAGIPVKVSLTQYCLRGETRRGRFVRPGIVAADPRIFPLARYVDVYMGERYIGRYLVDDTGGNVKGTTLDIWTPSCHQGRRFGRQWGSATLVAADEETIPHPAPLQINEIGDLTAIGSLLDGTAKRDP
jgi:3D (Asp-Asp-Asp) domain-containing protein